MRSTAATCCALICFSFLTACPSKGTVASAMPAPVDAGLPAPVAPVVVARANGVDLTLTQIDEHCGEALGKASKRVRDLQTQLAWANAIEARVIGEANKAGVTKTAWLEQYEAKLPDTTPEGAELKKLEALGDNATQDQLFELTALRAKWKQSRGTQVAQALKEQSGFVPDPASPTVLGRVGTTAITVADVEALRNEALNEAQENLYGYRVQCAEQLAVEQYTEGQAKDAGLELKDWYDRRLSAQVDTSDAALKRAFEEQKATFPKGTKFEAVKEQLKAKLNERSLDTVVKLVDQLRAESRFEVVLKGPHAAVGDAGL